MFCKIEVDEIDEGDIMNVYTKKIRAVFFWIVFSIQLVSGSLAYGAGVQNTATELEQAQQYGFITDKISGELQVNITREEFCELLMKLYNKIKPTANISIPTTPFKDTNNPDVLRAYSLNLVKGIGYGEFGPQNPVTKQEAGVMLLRIIHKVNPQIDLQMINSIQFSDKGQIDAWAVQALQFTHHRKIMSATNQKAIQPKINISREQAVLYIYRAYEAYRKVGIAEFVQGRKVYKGSVHKEYAGHKGWTGKNSILLRQYAYSGENTLRLNHHDFTYLLNKKFVKVVGWHGVEDHRPSHTASSVKVFTNGKLNTTSTAIQGQGRVAFEVDLTDVNEFRIKDDGDGVLFNLTFILAE